VTFTQGVLFLLLLALAPARAALQFDVFVGYGDNNVVHEAAWFPVACEVLNDGAPFVGVFELANESAGRTQIRQVTLELPTNTRKRFVVPVFASGGRYARWSARLLDERGKVRGERSNVQAKDRSWDTFMMGALPRSFSGLPALPEPKSRQEDYHPVVARLQVDQFPDSPIALEGLQAIYLNSEKALDLKLNQISALMAWLQAGGHLILAVEQLADLTGTPWLQSLAPCELTAIESVKFDGEFLEWLRGPEMKAESDSPTSSSPRVTPPRRPNAPRASNRRSSRASQIEMIEKLEADPSFDQAELPVGTGQLRDGQTLLATRGIPLVIQAKRGRGLITLLPFSPEREPFRSWKHRDWFWAKVAGLPPLVFTAENFNRYGGSSIDGVIGAMIDSAQIRKLPVTWLLLLLVVYLVVIGPLDQFWLKRIGKQMWTWITFPAYVALFSGLIYFIGYKLRAGETEWNELHFVDVLPRGEKSELHGRTYASVYSPVNAKYELISDQPHATLRSEFQGSWSGAQESGRANVEQRPKGFRAEIFVPVWTSQMYVSDWWQPADHPITCRLMSKGDAWEVTVGNRLNREVEVLHLALQGKIYALGQVPANQGVTFSIPFDRSAPTVREFADEQRNSFFGAVQSRRHALGDDRRGRLENNPTNAIAACLVSDPGASMRDPNQYFVAPPGFDVTALLDRGQAVLFAWAGDYSPTKSMNQFNPRRLRRDTLLRLAVPLPEVN
jgi:hypothetical protein